MVNTHTAACCSLTRPAHWPCAAHLEQHFQCSAQLCSCSWLQVIRIQPNESIYLKINNKVPGLGLNLDVTKLDLSYKARYNKHLPDAYERLILDVINGDKRLFIRNDELAAAWELFTPILKVGWNRTFLAVSLQQWADAGPACMSGMHLQPDIWAAACPFGQAYACFLLWLQPGTGWSCAS